MATFIWPPEVQWPPPANILLNYDVVSPGGVLLAPARLSGPTRGANPMAAVEVTISGILYDKLSRSSRPVAIIGEASLTGLEVGGGPIVPPGSPPGIWGPTDPRPGWGLPGPQPPAGSPPGIWGGSNEPFPGYGLPGRPPGTWGGAGEGFPTPPINLVPQPPLPPGTEAPQPGDPTIPLPPPAGSAGWPVQPVAVPAYVVINYPGVGPVIVAPPATAQPK